MKRILAVVKKVQVELAVFIFLFFELITRMPSYTNMHNYCVTTYALSYQEYGFGSRFFIGSIIRFFTDYLSDKVLWVILLLSLLFLIYLVACFCGSIIRKSDGVIKPFLICLAVLFLASPASISYLFYWGNYGRLELFMIIFVLLSFLALRNPITKWTIPLFCIMAMATHQIFIFLFFAPILIAVLFEVYKNKFSTKYVFFTITLTLTSVVSFFIFQFVKVLTFTDAQSMMDNVAAHTNIPLVQDYLTFEYFGSLVENFLFYSKIGGASLIFRGLITLALLSPLFLCFILFWRKCMKIEKSPYLHFIYLISMLSPLATIPAFVLAIDWGRWFAAIFICQFILAFYFLYIKATSPLTVALEFLEKIKKHKFMFLALVLYMASLGKFEALAVLDVSQKLLNNIAPLLVLFKSAVSHIF